jgi:pimeloyl-ACP methyl ester carboxylesterase
MRRRLPGRLSAVRASIARRLAVAWLAACALLPLQAEPLSSCRLAGVPHEALCASLARPLDPARPGGVLIELHYALLPALARHKKADPVFFVAGGPGQSAIALAGPVGAMLARFGHRRDIVFVDQRGTGRSAPLSCPDDKTTLPLAEAADPARLAQRARACLQQLQALPHGDLRFYTTTLAAADLEAVRAALGAERINLVGVSYGTRVVLEYMRVFPQRVRRAVLDGVAPPDMSLPWASAPDAQAAFDAMLRACAAEAACKARQPALPATWQAVLASLPRDVVVPNPATGVDEALRMTRDTFLGMVRAALYSPVTASALPAALEAAARGRFAPLAGLASALTSTRRDAQVAHGMHFSVVCAEDMPAHGAAAPPAPDFGAGLAPAYEQVCRFWPRGAVDPAFRRVPGAPAPVLLLSGGIDPATPPRHGERVAQTLGARARHEVVPNAGHGLLALPCQRDHVFRFVDAADDAAALRLDARCAQGVPRPPAFVPPGAEPRP